MSRQPHWLLDHASNTYSQSGEDGVIARILAQLPSTDGWCVEFGAWDGVHLSNVRKLIVESQYRAILIEGDAAKFPALCRNYAGHEQVQAVHAFVGFTADDGLDSILAGRGIPANFDFLSIDIDGNDYHVWAALQAYRPKVVCVEFNPTIPSEVDFVQAADPGVSHGASLRAMSELARTKGYQLVSVLSWNAFFVDEQYFAAFEIADNRPEVLRKDLSHITWIFTGYDGSVHLAGATKMLWHKVAMDARRVQLLPRVLRRFPDNYSRSQRLLFRILKRLRLLRA